MLSEIIRELHENRMSNRYSRIKYSYIWIYSRLVNDFIQIKGKKAELNYCSFFIFIFQDCLYIINFRKNLFKF